MEESACPKKKRPPAVIAVNQCRPIKGNGLFAVLLKSRCNNSSKFQNVSSCRRRCVPFTMEAYENQQEAAENVSHWEETRRVDCDEMAAVKLKTRGNIYRY